ncbi:hypothetical protein [Neobacillus mesonae]|uniref:hypothetical protein n=1 Tax=Neobacillus mesonae TaxID=1193713 RepID=UPI00082A8658|nr:hypothetical protein [Neobacillus mesonae]
MTTEKSKGLMILGPSLGVVGFILLFFSVDFGKSLADNWVNKQGGAGSSIYLIVIKGYTNNFLAAGSIFLGAGLATILISYYKMLNFK